MLVDPSSVPPTLWRNGAGLTRRLAVSPDDGSPAWRVSLADLTEDSAFSVYPGMNRLLTALGPLRLVVGSTTIDLVLGAQVRFAGEDRVTAVVDAPVRALNVIVTRGAFDPSVTLRQRVDHRGDQQAGIDPSDHLSVDLGSLIADVDLGSRPSAR